METHPINCSYPMETYPINCSYPIQQTSSNEKTTNASIPDPKRTGNNKLPTVSLFEQFLENWFPVWQAGEKKCNGQLPKQPANSAKIFVIVLTRHITLHTAHTKRNAKKTFWLLIHCGGFVLYSPKNCCLLMLHPSICLKSFGHGSKSTYRFWKVILVMFKMFGPLEGPGSQCKKYDKMPYCQTLDASFSQF